MRLLRPLLCLLLWVGCRCGADTKRPLDIPIQPASYGTEFFQQAGRAWSELSGGPAVQIAGDLRVHDKVRIRVMAGDYPDATDAQLEYETLIREGVLLDLTPYLDGPNWEGTGRWRDDFLPGILERWTREGRTYGLPYAFAVWALFYNEGLFAEEGWTPPATWDDFFVISERIQRRGLAPLSLPGVYLRYGDSVLRAGLHRLGGPAGYRDYQTLTAGVFTSPAWLRSAEVLQRIGQESLLAGWEGMTHTASQQAFLEGRAAMTLSASWLIAEMRGKFPPGFRLGVANLPGFNEGLGSSEAMQTQAAYYFLFRTGDTEREKATVDYFRFLTSRAQASAFAREFNAQVALRTVGPEVYADPALAKLARLMVNTPAVYDAAPPFTPSFQAFYLGGLNEYRFPLVKGRITPQEFGQKLEEVAAGERERIQNPDTVKVRHGVAAAGLGLLLLGLLAAGLWYGRRPTPEGPRWGRVVPSGLALSFVGPSLLLFVVFVLGPGLVSLLWSLVHWSGWGEWQWAGLFNFRWLLLESDTFWRALRNNLFLMLAPTAVVVPLSLWLATLLHQGIRGAGFFRAVILFPNLLGGIAAALLWMNAFDPHSGLVNAVLVSLGEVVGSDTLKSFSGYAWLSPDRLYLALVPIYVWMAVGFNTVLYLGAMQAIDQDYYEAATLDGASRTRQFFGITVPLMADTLVISAVFIVVAGLNTFEMVWLLTSQEPTSQTHVLSTLMVSTLFREFQVGRATAIAVVMFVLVFVGAWAVRRIGERRVFR